MKIGWVFIIIWTFKIWKDFLFLWYLWWVCSPRDFRSISKLICILSICVPSSKYTLKHIRNMKQWMSNYKVICMKRLIVFVAKHGKCCESYTPYRPTDLCYTLCILPWTSMLSSSSAKFPRHFANLHCWFF